MLLPLLLLLYLLLTCCAPRKKVISSSKLPTQLWQIIVVTIVVASISGVAAIICCCYCFVHSFVCVVSSWWISCKNCQQPTTSKRWLCHAYSKCNTRCCGMNVSTNVCLAHAGSCCAVLLQQSISIASLFQLYLFDHFGWQNANYFSPICCTSALRSVSILLCNSHLLLHATPYSLQFILLYSIYLPFLCFSPTLRFVFVVVAAATIVILAMVYC